MSNIKERVVKGKYQKGDLYKRERHEAIDYIEEKYPETAKEFQRLQFEQYLLLSFYLGVLQSR